MTCLVVLLFSAMGAMETRAFEGEVEYSASLTRYEVFDDRINVAKDRDFLSNDPNPGVGFAARSSEFWNLGAGGAVEFTGVGIVDVSTFSWDTNAGAPNAETFIAGQIVVVGILPALRFFEVFTLGIMAGVAYLSYEGVSNDERVEVSDVVPASFGIAELRFGNVFLRYTNIGDVDVQDGDRKMRFFGDKVTVGLIF